MSAAWGTNGNSRSLMRTRRYGTFAVVRILRTGSGTCPRGPARPTFRPSPAWSPRPQRLSRTDRRILRKPVRRAALGRRHWDRRHRGGRHRGGRHRRHRHLCSGRRVGLERVAAGRSAGRWPPYDCETHGAACSAAALDADRQPPRLAAVGQPAAAPAKRPRRRSGRGRRSGHWPARRAEPSAEPARRTGQRGWPEGGAGHAPGLSAAWPRQFAQVLVEILAGLPSGQATRSLGDRTGPGADRPAQLRRRRGAAAPDPARDDVAAHGGRGGDDHGGRLRVTVARAGPALRARARAPARTWAPPRQARWLCTEIETS